MRPHAGQGRCKPPSPGPSGTDRPRASPRGTPPNVKPVRSCHGRPREKSLHTANGTPSSRRPVRKRDGKTETPAPGKTSPDALSAGGTEFLTESARPRPVPRPAGAPPVFAAGQDTVAASDAQRADLQTKAFPQRTVLQKYAVLQMSAFAKTGCYVNVDFCKNGLFCKHEKGLTALENILF